MIKFIDLIVKNIFMYDIRSFYLNITKQLNSDG